MADITLVNLNMLFMRYGEQRARAARAAGALYLTRALEDAGFDVDFRDYQLLRVGRSLRHGRVPRLPARTRRRSSACRAWPTCCRSRSWRCEALKERYPDRTLVLGGVGPKAVEEQILARFPWIDIICRGEGERTGPELLGALKHGGDLSARRGHLLPRATAARSVHNPDRRASHDLDAIAFPAFEKVDLQRYAGYGMMTSRGCPYPCTFCSVAPVWNLRELLAQPAEHRRGDGAPAPRRRAWSCSCSRTSSSSRASSR